MLRALVLSNMLADAQHPERGSFVRDQVAALRMLRGLDVELFEFAPGAASLARAMPAARRLRPAAEPGGGTAEDANARFDVVHAHFGLTAWLALAIPARVRALTVHGTDLSHPRTRALTAAALPRIDLLAAVSAPLVADLPSQAARARAQVLPCGVDVERFRPRDRAGARAQLGLDPQRAYLLFAADPARPEKRHDRARELAKSLGAQLLALGGVAPERVPLWVNAANAVVVPSEREGYGLAVLEALACEIPVAATPVGIHPQALEGLDGCLCARYDLASWHAALAPHLQPGRNREARSALVAAPGDEPGPLRASALRFSAERMAALVAEAWRAALHGVGTG